MGNMDSIFETMSDDNYICIIHVLEQDLVTNLSTYRIKYNATLI